MSARQQLSRSTAQRVSYSTERRARALRFLAPAILGLFAFLLSACAADVFPGQRNPTLLLTATRQSWVVVPYIAASGAAGTRTNPPLKEVAGSGDPLPAGTAAALPSATATAVPTAAATATASSSPTPTQTKTPSPTPTPSSTPTATATPTPALPGVGGIPLEEIVIMSPAVRDTIRTTYQLGQQLGRNPNAFSKIGDSVALTPHYLTRFDSGPYVLGEYGYLQPAIDHYGGSFERYGVATRIGLHAWSLFDPLWADKDWCQPNEDMVACEIRLHNPGVLLVRLGSNDAGAAKAFDDNMRALVEYALENGIVPILATKADRFEGPDDRNNSIIRQIAADYNLPLWDFDHVATTIPGRGLGSDDVHMTMADSDDYTDPKSFERGYPVSDLTALMSLFAVYQETQSVP